MDNAEKNQPDKLLKVGAIGAVVTLICCFTPLLVIVFSAFGLAALIGVLDFVLFPLLAFFLCLLGWRLWKRSKLKSS